MITNERSEPIWDIFDKFFNLNTSQENWKGPNKII